MSGYKTMSVYVFRSSSANVTSMIPPELPKSDKRPAVDRGPPHSKIKRRLDDSDDDHSRQVNENENGNAYDFQSNTPPIHASILSTSSFYKKKPLTIIGEISVEMRSKLSGRRHNLRPYIKTPNVGMATKHIKTVRRKQSAKVHQGKDAKNRFEIVSVTLNRNIDKKPTSATDTATSDVINETERISIPRKFFKSDGLKRTITVTTMIGRHKLTSLSAHKSKPASEVKVHVCAQKDLEQDKVNERVNAAFPSHIDDEQKIASIVNESKVNEKSKPETAWPIRYRTESNKSPTEKPKEKLMMTRKSTRHCKGKDIKEQMIIDAGQRNIGPTVCEQCGMVYAESDPDEVALHFKIHNATSNNLKFMGWKKERVMREFPDGRIILVTNGDPKYAQKKVEAVLDVIKQNMETNCEANFDKENVNCYLFISTKNKIVGFAMAEPIKKTFEAFAKDDPNHQKPKEVNSVSAVCGINILWTVPLHRRQRIASRLLDCISQTFCYGCNLNVNQIAFANLTPDGKLLANAYFKTPNFLVYN